jgi:ABC-type uncharacterized transport system permease subunit
MNQYYIGLLTILIYLGTASAQGAQLFGILPYKRRRYLLGSAASLCAHGGLLYQLIEYPGGQNLHWLVMFSFTLWLMNIFIFLTSIRSKVENLIVLTGPLAALSVALALGLAKPEIMATQAQPGMLVHIFVSLLAMSLLILASTQALLMGFQNTLLKHHRAPLLLQILPPLQTMETLLFNIILGGTLLFSGSVLSGFFFEQNVIHSFMHPKTLLAMGAWFLLGLLLFGRKQFGWRGPTAVRWTLSATVLAFLSYFGTKALLL